MTKPDNSRSLVKSGHSIPFNPTLGKVFEVCGALIIQQVHFWSLDTTKARVNGFRWVYNTYDEWAEQLEVFSVSTIRNKIKELERMGVLVVGVFNKKGYDRTRWYRIDYEKLTKILTEKTGGMWQILAHPCVKNSHMDVLGINAPIPKTTTESTQEKQPLGASTTDGENMTDKPTAKGKVPNSSSVILKQLQASKSTTPKPEKITVTALIDVWRKTVPKHNSGVHFVGEFTLVQKGQFSNLIKRWGGADHLASAEYLAFVLSRWTKFTKYVEEAAGAKNTPALPHIAFLLKYCEEARNMFLDESKAGVPPPPKKVVKAPPKPQPEQEPDDAPMTLAELQEMGAKYGYGSKS